MRSSLEHRSALSHPVCVSRVQDVTLPREEGKKEIHDVRLDFLATAEKDATPFQETNRPASVRLYIFRRSSKPPFDKSLAPPPLAPPRQSPLATLFFCRYPGMQALQRRCSARADAPGPPGGRMVCPRGQTMKTGDAILRELRTREMHPCEL